LLSLVVLEKGKGRKSNKKEKNLISRVKTRKVSCFQQQQIQKQARLCSNGTNKIKQPN
jgi:hypothetical protein